MIEAELLKEIPITRQDWEIVLKSAKDKINEARISLEISKAIMGKCIEQLSHFPAEEKKEETDVLHRKL